MFNLLFKNSLVNLMKKSLMSLQQIRDYDLIKGSWKMPDGMKAIPRNYGKGIQTIASKV